jgi:hypothetical protein
MTQDEIIEMVKQTELKFLLNENWMMHDELVAFAKLVAAKAIAEAEKQSHPMMNMPHDRMVAMAYGYPSQRKPLTDEQILNVARDHYNLHQRPEISFARAIEAAHGIKE